MSVSAAYLSTCVVLVIAPGPSLAMVMERSLHRGRLAGLFTVAGNTTGLLCWASASMLGLTALIAASEVAFLVLKVVGACYLVWLGIRAWRRASGRGARAGGLADPAAGDAAAGDAAAGDAAAGDAAAGAAEPGPDLLTGYRRGWLTNITNPKAAVLYLALIPQFLPADPQAWQTATLMGVQMLISVSWYCTVVGMVGVLRRWLRRPPVLAAIDRLSGLVFIGLGARMLAVTRSLA